MNEDTSPKIPVVTAVESSAFQEDHETQSEPADHAPISLDEDQVQPADLPVDDIVLGQQPWPVSAAASAHTAFTSTRDPEQSHETMVEDDFASTASMPYHTIPGPSDVAANGDLLEGRSGSFSSESPPADPPAIIFLPSTILEAQTGVFEALRPGHPLPPGGPVSPSLALPLDENADLITTDHLSALSRPDSRRDVVAEATTSKLPRLRIVSKNTTPPSLSVLKIARVIGLVILLAGIAFLGGLVIAKGEMARGVAILGWCLATLLATTFLLVPRGRKWRLTYALSALVMVVIGSTIGAIRPVIGGSRQISHPTIPTPTTKTNATRVLHHGTAHDFVFSTDGQEIAIGSSQGLRLFNIATESTVTDFILPSQSGGTLTIQAIDWQPLTGELAASYAIIPEHGKAEMGISIWDSTGKLIAQLPTVGLASQVAWSPDGTYLASAIPAMVRSPLAAIMIWHTKDWSPTAPIFMSAALSNSAQLFSWSPDSHDIVYLEDPHTVEVALADSHAIVEHFADPNDLTVLNWSPGNQLIALGHSDGKLGVFNIGTQELHMSAAVLPDALQHLSWSPADDYILVASNHDVRIVDSKSLLPSAFFDPALSSSPTPALTPGAAVPVVSATPGVSTQIAAIAWSPNNQYVSALYEDGRLALWHIAA